MSSRRTFMGTLFRLLAAGSIALLLTPCGAALAGGGPVPVLVVHSYNLDYPWTRRQHDAFINTLKASPGLDVSVATESLDTKRRRFDADYGQTYADFLRHKYAGFRPALIYVTDDNALLFAQAHLLRLFPHSPVFFSGVNDYGVRDGLDPARVTGVFEKKEVAPNLTLLRQLDPQARSVVLVGDGSNTYQAIEREARHDLLAQPEFQATFVASARIDDLLDALRTRPEKYLLLTTLGGLADARGRVLPLQEAISRIVGLGRFTILSMEDVYQFDGVLGGFVTSGDQQGASAANLALEFLGGVPLTQIRPVERSPNAYLFDARELERKGLSLPAQLPAAVTVLNQAPGFVERHREGLLVTVYVLTATLFLVLLGAWRSARRSNRELRLRGQQIIEHTDALQASAERLNEAQRIAGIGSWSLDLATGELIWSDEIFRLFEIDPGRFTPSYESFLGAIHPEDRERVNQAYVDSVANRTPYEISHRLLFPDGRIKFVHERCETLYADGDGRPLLSRGTVQDITASMLAEQELRLYANIFEHSSEGILVTDRDNRVVAVNPAFTRLTGYVLDDIRGQNPRVLGSSRTPRETFQAMWTALNETGFWQGELWDRRKDGNVFPKWVAISVIRDEAGKILHHIANFTDISERKANEERIHRLAHHDALTGLFNRFSLQERLEQALLSANRENRQIAVMFIDMDRFKIINDTLGHHVGDALLIEVARRLQGSVRESDIVARFGGDEFVVVLTGIEAGMTAGAAIAGKIVQLLGEPYRTGDHELHSSPSIGISIYPDDGDSAELLMKNADTAMYHAKAEGRNNYQFFTAAMNEAASRRLRMEGDLRTALSEGQFELHYQPQMRTTDTRLSGLEALVRWRHPEQGLVPPMDFIPLAEETGQIEELGIWVLDEACRQMAAWREQGIGPVRVAVNISARQLNSPMLVAQVRDALARHRIAADELELEVTESAAMNDPEHAIRQLNELRQLGLRLAIDDFGTGYSSLSYLKRLPIQILKLDRGFVRDIETDENDAAISAATIALAHVLGLQVVAEGVETEAQRTFLARHGCDFLQGYLFSKPLPAAEATAFVRRE
jgi:diguanylate cyclase (GGDEF)-like protein/PAS domain S-box-containing protein